MRGYSRYSWLKNSGTGATIKQSEVDYVKKTVNTGDEDITVYYTYSSTRYADTAGSDPLTTTYHYTFHTTGVNGPTVYIRETISLIVSTAHRGTRLRREDKGG